MIPEKNSQKTRKSKIREFLGGEIEQDIMKTGEDMSETQVKGNGINRNNKY